MKEAFEKMYTYLNCTYTLKDIFKKVMSANEDKVARIT